MDNTKKLKDLGAQIEERRLQLDLSKNALCQKFGQLGSTKTYGRILSESDDLDGMDIEKQLGNYSAALEVMTGFTEDPEEEKIYTDFEHVREGLTLVGEALQQRDNTRVILVTGPSGAGKSTFIRAVQQDRRFGKITYVMEASEVWGTNPRALLLTMLGEISIIRDSDETPSDKKRSPESMLKIKGTDELLDLLIERINGKRIVIVIDEVHHLGAPGFNLIKTIVNNTNAVFVLAAHPQLLAKITARKFAETSQLWQNRLYANIKISVPSAGDVMEFFKRKGLKFSSAKDASAISVKASDESEYNGRWKFVKRLAKECRRQNKEVDMDHFAKILIKVKARISML